MNKKEREQHNKKYWETLEAVKHLDLFEYIQAHLEANIGGYCEFSEYEEWDLEVETAVLIVQNAMTRISQTGKKLKGLE